MPSRSVLLVASVLAACASPFEETISPVSSQVRITRAAFSAFAEAPLVEIRGARPGGTDDAAIAAALSMPAGFRDAPFTAVPSGPETTRMTRIVLNFGQEGGVNADGLCSGRTPEGRRTEGMRVAAVFCRGGSPGGAAVLTRGTPLAPGDPAFTAAMRRLFTQIAPGSTPETRPRAD